MHQNADTAAYLSMEEVDAVEVYAALGLVVKTYEAHGNKTMSDHYRDLLDRLQASDGYGRRYNQAKRLTPTAVQHNDGLEAPEN